VLEASDMGTSDTAQSVMWLGSAAEAPSSPDELLEALHVYSTGNPWSLRFGTRGSIQIGELVSTSAIHVRMPLSKSW